MFAKPYQYGSDPKRIVRLKPAVANVMNTIRFYAEGELDNVDGLLSGVLVIPSDSGDQHIRMYIGIPTKTPSCSSASDNS